MAAAVRAFQSSSVAHVAHRSHRSHPLVAAAAAPERGGTAPPEAAPQLSRRQLQAAAVAALLAASAAPAQAVGFQKELKRKKIPEDEYTELAAEPRLKIYELKEGSGAAAKEGSRVSVHFVCKYRGLSVVSTYNARVLGGNRTVAEPFEFIVGQPVTGSAAARNVESAGGLYAGGGGPKPPPALSRAAEGMRVGGKRSVLVPADLGYGGKGEQEIPPDCPQFELQVELLSVA